MVDAMLLDLFRDEVATHLTTIEAGFDALDDEGDDHEHDILDAISRAAHSIKGAARIVDVAPGVAIANAIESLFDAAKAHTAWLTRHDTDVIARGVVALRAIAAASDELLSAESGAAALPAGEVEKITKAINALAKRRRGEGPKAATPPPMMTSMTAPPRPSSPVDSGVFSLARADAALLDLFRMEAETHGAALSNELLVLESDPTAAEPLQGLMRAAHSIKGAARVVGLDIAVALAHVMEDCFVAAQNGRIVLGAADIDILLRATDIVLAIAANVSAMEQWEAQNTDRVAALVRDVEGIIHAGMRRKTDAAAEAAEPVPKKPLPLSEPIVVAHERPERANAPVDRVVRVAVSTIDTMMNLAGESLVEARRFEPVIKAMHKLAQRQSHVTDLLVDVRFGLGDVDPRIENMLDTARSYAAAARRATVELMNELDSYHRRAEDLTGRAYRTAISSRMRPFSDGVHAFPRLVRDLGRKLDKQVQLVISGDTVGVDRDILEKLEAPLNHLLRNAIDHGIESPRDRRAAGKPERATLRLEARHWAGMLTVTVADDGKGIDPEVVRRRIVEKKLVSTPVAEGLTDTEVLDYLFAPGFSTSDKVTEISGRGVGLDIVRSVVEEVGGSVRLQSEIGKGTSFNLQLPITLSVIRAVVVEIAGEPYAFPMMRIEKLIQLSRTAIQTLEGQQYFVLEGKNIGLVPGHQVLDLASTPNDASKLPVIILSDRAHVCGVAVDKFLGEHDLVIRPLDPRLGKIADISAAAVLTDGTPILIVDVEDMVRSIVRMLQRGQLGGIARASAPTQSKRLRVLVVDDSITVREVQRQLLGNRGYEVTVAVDGMDGWHAVRDGDFDLVITDVDMPRMNGIDFVKSVKRDPRTRDVPMMIVSYRDREEDKQRGLEAGADYYFTKSDFHDDALLHAVAELIGTPG
ncbi:MAG TPA: Hpt domain-containing protein [Kofleriaceae bacterium]|jgi:two-component system sensor histidine kinase and response regulator WspE